MDAPSVNAPADAPAVAVAARNRRFLLLLGIGALCMVGFGFALSPLYYLTCRALGVQLRPNSATAIAASGTHTGRFIEVFFERSIYDGLPVYFAPEERVQKVEVGMDVKNIYHVQNRSKSSVHFRPIHTISPDDIGKDFGMKVCFCFTDQVLAPGESRDFTVVYTFAPSLDTRIDNVTICYSLHSVQDDEDVDAQRKRFQATVKPGQVILTPGFGPLAKPVETPEQKP